MLKILLLGPPAIEYDDQPLKIQRRQIRALIYFLACHPAGIGRDQITTLFWPNNDESAGRKHLRELLARLRTQLPDPDILHTDADRVGLNPESVFSDVFEFNKLIQPVTQFFRVSSVKPILPDAMVAKLEQAVGLWRSPNFWSGGRFGLSFALDNWFLETAASMELGLTQNLERLAYHYAALTEYDRAITYTQIALKIDTQNEELQEKLLSWFYKSGRISEARSFYSYLANFYQRENEGDSIESHFPYLSDEDINETIDSKELENIWHPATLVTSHFVGRAREIEDLKRRFSRGDVVILLGETGSGKTRLVQQFYKSLEQKPRVLLATCRHMESNLPLHPFIDLIRNFVRDEDWEALQPQWQQNLSILVPGVNKTPSSFLGSVSSQTDLALSNIFEAIRQLLLVMSKNGKLLFVLEDAHWCDLTTAQAINYLIERKFFLDHGLCIITSRPILNDPVIREWWQKQGQMSQITRIQVPMLDRDEAFELVRHSIGQIPSSKFIEYIQNVTIGNPLFILEIMNALISSNTDLTILQNQSALPLSGSLSALLLEKEQECSPEARKILLIAAICGFEFNMEVLEITSNISALEVVQSLEELERLRIIQPVGRSNQPGWYCFFNSIFPEIFISRLSHSRQCLLHNRVASAMAASQNYASNQHAGIIARHFEAAGRPLPAFHNWLQAGQYARGLYAIQEANTAYRNAHRLLSSIESTLSEGDIYDLYSKWNDLSFSILDLETLLEGSSAMYKAGERKDSLLLRGAGLSGIAIATALKFDVDKSLALFEESIKLINQTDNLFEKINTYNRMGFTQWLAMQYEKAREMFETAIKLGSNDSNLDIQQAVTRSQNQLSLSLTLLGWPKRALKVGEDALRNSFQFVTHPERQAEAHQALAMANFVAGQYEKSLEQSQKSLQISETIQNPRISVPNYIVQARIALINGQFNTTWNLAKKILIIAGENNFVENVAEAHCLMGDLFRVLHDYPKAIQEYSIGYKDNPEPYSRLNSYYRLGFVIAKNGQIDEGLQILKEALNDSENAGFKHLALSAQIFIALILAETGKKKESDELFDHVEKEAGVRGIKSPSRAREYFKAELLIKKKETGTFESQLNKLEIDTNEYPAFWFSLLKYQFQKKYPSSNTMSEVKTQEINELLDSIGSELDSSETQDLFRKFRFEISNEISTEN